jgi:hypothetical protein
VLSYGAAQQPLQAVGLAAKIGEHRIVGGIGGDR